MKGLLLATLVLCSAFSVGCTGLARGGAAGISPDAEEDEDDFGPLPVTSVSAPKKAPPPGQMEVAWEDNGIPIRQLTGDGAPQEMKLPSSHPKKPR